MDRPTEYRLFLPFEPVPKSYQACRGRMILTDNTRDYQNHLEKFAKIHAPKMPLDGYLAFQVTFYLRRKESQKNEKLPATKPDLDNLLKSLFDPLERAAVFTNDSRFVEGLVKKRFAGGHDAAGVIQPGTQLYFYSVEI